MPNGGDVGHAENGMGEYFNFAIKSSLGGRNVGAQEVHDKRGMKTVCSVPSMHMAEVMNRYSVSVVIENLVCTTLPTSYWLKIERQQIYISSFRHLFPLDMCVM